MMRIAQQLYIAVGLIARSNRQTVVAVRFTATAVLIRAQDSHYKHNANNWVDTTKPDAHCSYQRITHKIFKHTSSLPGLFKF